MTKKSFLEKLKRKLSILNEEEKQDILNEYKDIIEEKMKHGKTEEEAVADFGDFDELVGEILSAYKINPKASKEESSTKEKAKDFLESGEELIKDGAKKLTEVTDKIVNDFKEHNTDITVELVFELVLKGLCALIIMGILTIPFAILSQIGSHIFDFALFPLSPVLKVLWKILVSVLYFGSCIFLIIAMFKEYVKNPGTKNHRKSNKTNPVKKEKTSVDEEKVETNKETNEEMQYEPRKEIRREPRNTGAHTASTLVLILLKIFIIFTFMIPLWICIICLFIFISILIFLLIKGIGVLGIILGTVGIIIFLLQLSNLLYNGLFNAYKIHFYPFIIALIFMVIGTIMTIDFITGIDYINTAPSTHEKKNTYEYTLTKPIQIEAYSERMEYVIDDTLPDNQVVIDVTYYDDYVSIEKNDIDLIDHQEVRFHTNHESQVREQYNQFMEHLRNNKIFNYEKLRDIRIKVTGNTNTKSLINID